MLRRLRMISHMAPSSLSSWVAHPDRSVLTGRWDRFVAGWRIGPAPAMA